jgi:hypothetical protein
VPKSNQIRGKKFSHRTGCATPPVRLTRVPWLLPQRRVIQPTSRVCDSPVNRLEPKTDKAGPLIPNPMARSAIPSVRREARSQEGCSSCWNRRSHRQRRVVEMCSQGVRATGKRRQQQIIELLCLCSSSQNVHRCVSFLRRTLYLQLLSNER